MSGQDGLPRDLRARLSLSSIISARGALLIILVFPATAYMIYQGGFASPMIYDSLVYIEGNRHVFDDGSLMDILGLVPARPLFTLSVYFNYSLMGMDPYYLRLFNVFLLAASGLMFVFMTYLILNTQESGHDKNSHRLSIIAFVMGFLFVAHPAQSFAVLYIWQGSTLMSCFFYFLCVFAYIQVRTDLVTSPHTGYGLVGLCYFLGLASKEIAVTVPLALAIAEITILKTGFRELLRRILIIAGITLPPLIGYILLTANLGVDSGVHSSRIMERLHTHYQASGLSPIDAILTLPNMLVSYLTLILAPLPDRLLLLQPQWIVQSPWSPPHTIASYIVIIISIVLCALLARKRPVTAFGLAMWMVSLAPECLLSNFLFFGQRAILPMVGILLVIGDGLRVLFSRWGFEGPGSIFRAMVSALLISLAVMFAIVSHNQARGWRPVKLWEEMYSRLPEYSKGMESLPYADIIINYSGALIRKGEYSKAVETLAPLVNCMRRESDDGLCAITVSGSIQAEILINMGSALKRSGRIEQAVYMCRWATRVDPENALAWNNLAAALEASGEIRAALPNYRKAHELDPREPSINFNLASALVGIGNYPEAIEYYRMIPAGHGKFTPARLNMSAALLESGQLDRAAKTIEKTLLRIGDNADLYNLLGVVYIRRNRPAEALKSFEKALETKPDHNMARRNLKALKHDLQRGRP